MCFRMCTYLCICFILIMLNSIVMCKNPSDLTHYLQKRSNAVKRGTEHMKAILDLESIQTLDLPSKAGHILSMFNTSFLLLDSNVYALSNPLEQSKFELKPFVPLENRDGSVKFVRTTQVGEFYIALVAYSDGLVDIYRFSKNENEYVHSISTKKASDARFFKQNGEQFLVITNSIDTQLVPTKIYKWIGSHFDEIDSVLTQAANEVTSFTYDNFEVIIIAQNRPGLQTLVFQFDRNGLRKIQYLNTNEPQHLITYKLEEKHYLVVVDGCNSKLYLWREREFIKWKLTECLIGEHTFLTYVKDHPTVFVTSKDEVIVYNPSSDDFSSMSRLKFREHIDGIVDIQAISSNVLLVLAKTVSGSLKAIAVLYKQTIDYMEHNESSEDPLLYCMEHLEQLLEDSNLQNLKKSRANETVSFKGRMAQPAFSAAFSDTNFFLHKQDDPLVWLKQDLNLLNRDFNNLKPVVAELTSDMDTLVVYSQKVIIQGNLVGKAFVADGIHIKQLNSIDWNPNQWLSYTKPQQISGPVTAKSVVAETLRIPEGSVFEDALLLHGNQKVFGKYSMDNLRAESIYAPSINDINFSQIYLRSGPPTNITGTKTFDSLDADVVQADTLNQMDPYLTLKTFIKPTAVYNFASNLRVKNLNVRKINGVNWNVFKDSVFRIGKTTKITGNLNVTNLKSIHLYADSVDGIPVQNLLTTSTDQTINSTIRFNNVQAENIECGTVNGVDLSKDVVIAEQINGVVIKGPVNAMNIIEINKDIYIDGPIDTDFHIVGTDVADLYQFYHGKVRIVGNLYVSNVSFHKDTSLLVDGKKFDKDTLSSYWLKDTRQAIPFPVTLTHVNVPHLKTKALNNVPVQEYLLITDIGPESFIFNNATVYGNIYLNNNVTNIPNIEEISRKSVKYSNGDFIITGQKTFSGKLKIDKLGTHSINQQDLSKALLKDSHVMVTGKKRFHHIVVSGDFSSDSVLVNELNDVNLNKLKSEALYIDEPISMSNAQFKELKVDDLFASKLNGKPLSEYFVSNEWMNEAESLKSLKVNGNVTINSVWNVSSINRINMKKAISQMHQNVVVFKTPVTFTGNMNVGSFDVSYVNDLDLPKLLPNILDKTTFQNITGAHTFNKITTPSMHVARINGYNLENLINVNEKAPQDLYVPKGLELRNVTFLGSVDARTLTCDLHKALERLYYSDGRQFEKITVLQGVNITDDASALSYILMNAVAADRDNIINAPVTFQTHLVSKDVESHKNINGVNLTELFEDVVMKISAQTQVISGKKTFQKLSTDDALVRKNTKIPVINNVNMTELGENIVYKNQDGVYHITGKKMFYSGFEVDHLYTDVIAGVLPDNLVSLENPKLIPSAIFTSMVVSENFNVAYVNNFSVQHVMENRLLINSDLQTAEGFYWFENILLQGDSSAPCINDIRIEDIVTEVAPQTIRGDKTFLGGISFHKNIDAGVINGYKLKETYEDSVLLGNNVEIRANVNCSAHCSVNQQLSAESLNGVPIDDLREMMNNKRTELTTSAVQKAKRLITGVVQWGVDALQRLPDNFMYIDVSYDLQIPLPKTVGAKATSTSDGAMLHVDGVTSGEYCGLPSRCQCPVQHTVHITSQNSVNMFLQDHYFRTFTYTTENVTVHLFTDSVCTNSFCRTNSSNEASILSWSSIRGSRESSGSFIHPQNITGYVSDVEFFEQNGHVYVVICRYYDCALNKHDLGCLVMKITKENDEAQVIQVIPSKAAKSAYLVYTAQGVVLVIGNIIDNKESRSSVNYTSIYRFNSGKDQFELLRRINSVGCSSAAAVVLNENSLIILSQYQGPVLILRYHSFYDNYYIYQSFDFDFPILSVSTFYVGGFGVSDAYLNVVVESGSFFVYSFREVEGWRMITSGGLDGLQSLVPFEINQKLYLFAPSTNVSALLTVMKHSVY